MSCHQIFAWHGAFFGSFALLSSLQQQGLPQHCPLNQIALCLQTPHILSLRYDMKSSCRSLRSSPAWTNGINQRPQLKSSSRTDSRLFSLCGCMHGIHVERALVPWYAAKPIHTGCLQATHQAGIQKAVFKPLSKSSVDQATESPPSKHPAVDHTDVGLEEP